MTGQDQTDSDHSAHDDRAYLYESVARHLADAIRRGTFAVGERMPSLRQIARQHKISVSTATQVYHLLEDMGWVTTHPRSGYYVRKKTVEPDSEPAISQPPDEPSRPINMQLGLRHYQTLLQPGLLSLGVVADPVPDLIPWKTLGRAYAGVARRAMNLTSAYGYPYGHVDLRVQIARRMTDAGCYLTPDDLIVTTGCQDSLNLALRAVAQAGDTIAIESPTYIGIPHLLDVLGLKALEIPTHPRSGVDIDALTQALARHPVKACLFMPSCQNPLGASMPESNKRQLVELLARAGIPLIEDDAFGDLTFERPRPKAAKAFDRDGNVLYCSSFAKVLGPGQRIGWMAPGRYWNSVAYLQSIFHSLASPVWQQLGMAEFLAGRSYARTVDHAIRVYKKRLMAMRHWVREYFPEGTRVTNPRGGFTLWVELPETVDVTELNRRALEQGIGFSPGMLFSPTWGYTHHIRLCCGGSTDWHRIEPAMATLGRLATAIMRAER
jgi:DNA-binding transcriptional MocR family regulator